MGIIGNWGRRIAAAAAALALCACAVPSGALASVDGQDPCACESCACNHETCDHDHDSCTRVGCATDAEALLEDTSSHALGTQAIDYHKAPIVKGNPTITKFHLHELLHNKEYRQDGSGDVYERWEHVEFGSPLSRYDPLNCRYWTRYSNGQQHKCVYGKFNGYDYGPTWYDVGDPQYHLIREDCECGGWALSVVSHHDGTNGEYDGLCDWCGGKIVDYCFHEWSPWKIDDTYHWQECGECGAYQWFGKHELYDVGNGVKACKYCTYVTNQNYHVWETQYNDEEHWEECTLCHETRKHEQHQVKWCHDGKSAEDSEMHWRGCDCGWRANDSDFGSYGSHKWEMNYDNDCHWYECSICGLATQKQMHSTKCVERGSGHIWICELNDCTWESPNGVEEHKYECKDNGNGTHSKKCSYCDMQAVAEGHNIQKTKQADGSYAWQCQMCGYTLADSTGKLAQAEANTKVKNTEVKVTSTSPYNVRIPTLVDIVDVMLGNGGSAKLVFWQGNDEQPSGSEKLSAAMKKSSGGGTSTYQSVGRIKWDEGRAPTGSGQLYVGVEYNYVEDGQTRTFTTGKTFVGVPRAEADGWEIRPDGKWGYLQSMAPVCSDWVEWEGGWYWMDADGAMATGWRLVDGRWYLFGASGAMKTGWQWIDGTWYLLGSSGAMKTGWAWDAGKCYYFSEQQADQGAMLRNTVTPDGFAVGADGAWVK